VEHKITFEETENSIQGFVDDHLIIQMCYTNVTKTSPKKDWLIQNSSCLPADIEWANAYLEAMTMVIKRAENRAAIKTKGMTK